MQVVFSLVVCGDNHCCHDYLKHSAEYHFMLKLQIKTVTVLCCSYGFHLERKGLLAENCVLIRH